MYKGRVGSYFFGLICLFDLGNNSANQVNISDDIKKRIIRKRNLPEFGPLSSNHSLQTFCTVQQSKTYEVKNFTLKEKSRPYCNDSSSAESLTKNVGEPVTITVPNLDKTSNYSTSWYKDCKQYVKNASEISFSSVQQSDSALYTYIITYMYNGENHCVCGKKWLIVKAQKIGNPLTNEIAIRKRQQQSPKGHVVNMKPKILGVGNVTITEVEIGQNLNITCKASVVAKRFSNIYWIRTNKSNIEDLDDILDTCTSNMTKTCKTEIETTNSILSTELHLINISGDDIMYPYKCILNSAKGSDCRLFVLKLKERSKDISERVFTTTIIGFITCSVSIVFLIGLCIWFRIEIVLLYRSITGVDETIGDGKEYDAYLSFESFSTSESDERHFAFQTLAPILENCFGFKLCIFERDVIPGGALVDDIHSFLEKSRRLIIVLSRDYISCKAMYELESGLHKAMVERQIKVILIEFTPLSEQSFLPESLQLLKMRRRVKWKGDKSYTLNSQFWKKIQYLMPAKPTKSSSSFSAQNVMKTNDNEMIILNN
ncbi:interleukin-18 receptor 1 [Rhinoderma darwinii]|uniref:interleukin-18 receptor 1 n=1 Tax=Rhinoderma darwinii TaxID=43563 RepID=UPI003F676781